MKPFRCVGVEGMEGKGRVWEDKGERPFPPPPPFGRKEG